MDILALEDMIYSDTYDEGSGIDQPGSDLPSHCETQQDWSEDELHSTYINVDGEADKLFQSYMKAKGVV